MRRNLILCAPLLLAAGCTPIVENSQRANHTMRGRIYDATLKVQEYIAYTPEDNSPQAAQTRFCYKTMADIVCYDGPREDISNKLVGSQVGMAPVMPIQTASVPMDMMSSDAVANAPIDSIDMGDIPPPTGAEAAVSASPVMESVNVGGTPVTDSASAAAAADAALAETDAANVTGASGSVQTKARPRSLMPAY
jgi:hypothetical protein